MDESSRPRARERVNAVLLAVVGANLLLGAFGLERATVQWRTGDAVAGSTVLTTLTLVLFLVQVALFVAWCLTARAFSVARHWTAAVWYVSLVLAWLISAATLPAPDEQDNFNNRAAAAVAVAAVRLLGEIVLLIGLWRLRRVVRSGLTGPVTATTDRLGEPLP